MHPKSKTRNRSFRTICTRSTVAYVGFRGVSGQCPASRAPSRDMNSSSELASALQIARGSARSSNDWREQSLDVEMGDDEADDDRRNR
eukprot:2260717-Rhodomonas_salina.2